MAAEMAEVAAAGVQLAVVSGAGNIFRGLAGSQQGVDRVTGDHMGMVATVVNCLALQDVLVRIGVRARVMSAIAMPQVCEPYNIGRARHHLDAGRMVLLAGGTGSPFFSTDSAAALRAAELQAEAVLKATKVDGVFDRDPMSAGEDAIRYRQIHYDDVLAMRLGVMDATAVALCRENLIPMIVFNLNRRGSIMQAVLGEPVGTIVSSAATAVDD